jgi:beta-phosphoglucomutase
MAGKNPLAKISGFSAVIFDMDGVIVDTEPLSKKYEKEFLPKIGVSKPRDLNVQGLTAKAYATLLKQEYGLEYNIDELIMMWRSGYLSYLAVLDQIPVIPGAPELIQYFIDSGHKLALASSANPKRIKLILERAGLEPYFSIIVHGDDVQNSKPAPDVFLLAAQRLDVTPSECLVIEDSTNGVKATKAAGMFCVAYAGSLHNSDDLSEADLIIEDFIAFTRSLKARSDLLK